MGRAFLARAFPLYWPPCILFAAVREEGPPAVKIRIDEIRETGKAITFTENIGELNELLAREQTIDYQFRRAVDVHMTYYRSGADLFFEGQLAGEVSGNCARCLEAYPFTVKQSFVFVLKPATPEEGSEPELSQEDLSLSYYAGDEIDLSPLIREELIFALPTRPLCRDDCSGLCPHCGINRNLGPCACRDDWADPRLEPLRALKLPRR